MNMQHKITTAHPLLDSYGYLSESGYSTSMLLDYKRSAIKAKKYRIKEWDYYYVGNSRNAVAMTIADNSYMALISVTFFDFEEKWQETNTLMIPFTFGKLRLPEKTSAGVTAFKNKKIDMNFSVNGTSRILFCNFKNFTKNKDLKVHLVLSDFPQESMVIATPFAEDKTAFYYNQKINTMKSHGSVIYGDRTYDFSTPDTLGLLDWGRGVWTYENTWYWGSLSIRLGDGIPFGFNIGYGFGDTSAATENMVIYNGIAHKLSRVDFKIPLKDGADDFMSPWKFTSDDGRFELDFIPILDRFSAADLLVLKSIQHQVFGHFTGKIILDDGKVIELKNAIGFAEKVFNRY